jgi:hypothetical protein
LDKETHKAVGHLEAKATSRSLRNDNQKGTGKDNGKNRGKDKNNGGCGWEGGGREADFSAEPLTMRL